MMGKRLLLGCTVTYQNYIIKLGKGTQECLTEIESVVTFDFLLVSFNLHFASLL